MAKSFAAQIADWAQTTEDDLREIVMEASQDLMEAAQTPQIGISRGATSFEIGKIPVAETDLINSLTSGLNGASPTKGEFSYSVAIAGFELGDTIKFEWTQEYARAIDQGYTTSTGKHVPGRHFVGANVARWQEFVDAAVARLK